MSIIELDVDAHDLKLLDIALTHVQDVARPGLVTETDEARLADLRSVLDISDSLKDKLARAFAAAVERERAGSKHPPTVRAAIETVIQHYKNCRLVTRTITPFVLAAATLAIYLTGGLGEESGPGKIIVPPGV